MDSSIWEDGSINGSVKFEKNQNYNGVPIEDDEYSYLKKKLPRDPLSHRIIEKRRRDRMNNCLSDLSRLIPSEYMKKGRGRIEKTEIIEMAIRHMKHLQSHPCTEGTCCPLVAGTKLEVDRGRDHERNGVHVENRYQNNQQTDQISAADQYRLGYNECLSETMHFLVEVEGFFSSDSLCLQLTSHLNNHCDNVIRGKAFMAQLTAAVQAKRRFEDIEDKNDKQGMNGDYTNGYHQPDSRNGHNQEHNGNAYRNPNAYPADSSSSLMPVNGNNMTRAITQYPQQLSPSSYQGDSGSYKFKEDIRKRFCKEAGTIVPLNSGLPTRRVPAFVLSPRGSHYVPITLDLPNCEEEIRTEQSLLHPVTISVCFPSQNGRGQGNFADSGQSNEK